MQFAFTSEQQLSRNALRELLREHCGAAQLRAVFESEQPRRVPGLWAELTKLGVVGALAPEALGGLGLDAIDLCVLLEETGRAGVPEPVVETAAVAVPLLAALADVPRAAHWLSRVLSGEVSVAVGLAGSAYVVGADTVELILLEREAELHLCERERIEVQLVSSVDRARRLARVSVTPSAETRVASAGRARPLLAAAHDHAALGTAAQLVGLAARMLELTVAHVKTRKQFGQAIGAFQAVKHQLVDAHLAVEFAGPLVYRAAHSIAHADAERSLHVSMAKAFASDAALLAARKALQLHGAIGYSYEYELQLFMKRAWALAAAYGDAREHRARIADAMLVVQGERHA
jgi:alkylation response protein AidB-like acyl-CoA dehydrogenase